MNFDVIDIQPPAQAKRDLRKLIPAVVISLGIHAGLLIVVINGEVGRSPPVERQVVSVRFLPQNPLLEPDESESVAEIYVEAATTENSLVESVDAITDNTQAEADPFESVEAENLAAERDSDRIQISEPEASLSYPDDASELAPPVTAPSVLAVQETLRSLQDTSISNFYVYDCNPLEEEAGIKDCRRESAQASGANAYLPEQRRLTYQTLNPTRTLSRSERSLGVVSDQSAALAARVGELNIPEGLGEYLTQELEAGISHNVNLGNRAVQHMINSTDKSAAGAMARELLNDPWVIKKTKQQEQRQVLLPN